MPLYLRSNFAGGGVWVEIAGNPKGVQRVGGIRADSLRDDSLPAVVSEADLVGASVGPSTLPAVGSFLASLLRARLEAPRAPLNLVTFGNHRRAPELLTWSVLKTEPSLAWHIGYRLGIGGAAVWHAVAKREIIPEGLRSESGALMPCCMTANTHPRGPEDLSSGALVPG